MIVFPAIAATVSLACAIMLGRDAMRRPSPDKIAWIIAFGLFTTAAGVEVAGSVLGWTPLMARVYYLAGAVLVVGFLGLGQLYLVARARITRVGPGIALFMVAVAVALVVDAPVDPARLSADGWHALERGPAMVALTVAINVLGTVIVVGGAAYSAWQFWRRGIFRHRMIGCLLIALGTLVVASGGTLTRLGRPEYLYIAMSIGISIIFAGYLEARRREAPAAPPAAAPAHLSAPELVHSTPAVNGHGPGLPVSDPALSFLVSLLASETADGVAERCAFWSVEPTLVSRFDRAQARRVWSVRLRLPNSAQSALDRLPASTQIQLADLYLEVLAPGVAEARAEHSRDLQPHPN